MPTQLVEENNNEIRAKIAYSGEVLIIYINCNITLEELCHEIREICRFSQDQIFTMKWVDEEGDPCTISTQLELDEAIRLYEINKDSELTIHVFPNAPAQPGMPCQGEDRSIYRRGARRWRKLYRVNGHIFQAKRFNRRAFCALCKVRIWGLGRQGFKCIQCKLLVHKKCHKAVNIPCSIDHSRDTLPHEHASQENNGDMQHDVTQTIKSNQHQDSLRDSEYNESPPDVTGEAVPVEDPNRPLEDLEPGSQRQYSLNDFDLFRVIGRGDRKSVV